MEYTQEEVFAAIGQLYLRVLKLEQIVAAQQKALESNSESESFHPDSESSETTQ